MKFTSTVAAAAALCLAAGCSSRSAPAELAGRRIAEGPAQFLSASPDGTRVAWLSGCAPAPAGGKTGISCALLVAPVLGGAAQRVADGVAATGGSFAWGPSSRIAFVAGGDLQVASPDGALARVRGGAGAGNFAFAPAPGGVLAAMVRGAGGARDLAVWRESGGEPVVLARDVASFAFSPDGALLGAIVGVAPGRNGDLVVVPVGAEGKAPPSPVVVAHAVGEFRWAPGATRLAWLEGFDPRIGAGTLASAMPGGPQVSFAPRVTAFELSPSGDQLAFVRHVTEGTYTAQLELSPSHEAVPAEVTREAASFEFSSDGRWLYFLSGCAPAGDRCALFRAPAGLGTGQSPERLAAGVVGFALDRWHPDRVLVSFARRDGAGVDLALWSGGKLLPLDRTVLAGSPRFLPPDGRRVAYVVSLPARAGVHVVDLP